MFNKYTNSFLKDFDYEEILSKFPAKEFLSFKKGCFIFSENDPVSNIYFILTGKVEIIKFSKVNVESLYFAAPGDLIGLDGALTGELHFNSAYVLQKTDTVSVKKNDFLKIVKRNDEFSKWILKYLSCRINSIK